jgi:hypothetical protein
MRCVEERPIACVGPKETLSVRRRETEHACAPEDPPTFSKEPLRSGLFQMLDQMLRDDGGTALGGEGETPADIPDDVDVGASRAVQVDPAFERVVATAYVHEQTAAWQ